MQPKCKSARLENLSAQAIYCGCAAKFPVWVALITAKSFGRVPVNRIECMLFVIDLSNGKVFSE